MQLHVRELNDPGLWAKSIVIFNAIREYGQQSIRSLADRTGLSKSSVHRHLQAMGRRDRYPESSLWETEAGRTWLIRLLVATLFVFGLKRGVGAETLSEFLGRLHLDSHVGWDAGTFVVKIDMDETGRRLLDHDHHLAAIRRLLQAVVEQVVERLAQQDLVSAGAILAILPPLLLFAALNRYYVRGLFAGGSKG